jgi:Fe-S-cluster containining protein
VNSQPPTHSDPAEALCLACGLCCNGALFKNVKLQPGDDRARLRVLGLSPRRFGAKLGCGQPCSAFTDGQCSIYLERPVHCRSFECLLLMRYKSGRLKAAAALKRVALARRRVATVNRLLNSLGNRDEALPLHARFQQTMAASHTLESDRADDLSKLTIAMHRLNLLLSQDFYPAS